MRIVKVAVVLLGMMFATPFTAAYAVDAHHANEMVDAEVKKVNKSAGKLTLKHGPLKNLGMPAMTMVFRVKDAVMLDQVKAGDKVKFFAEKINGAYTVVEFQSAK